MTGASRALVVDFLDMLAAERGAAKNTLEAYGRDLNDYVAALAQYHMARVNFYSALGKMQVYESECTKPISKALIIWICTPLRSRL